jgi:hypothetical protein
MSSYFHRLLDLTGIVSAPPPMEPRPTLADGGVPVAGTGEAPVGADPAQGSGPGPDVVEHVEVLEIGGLGVGSGGLGDPGRAGHGPTLEPGSNRGMEVPGARSGSADPGFEAASDAREPATVREIATEATTVERIAGESGPRGVGQATGETVAVRAEGRRGTVEDGGSVAAAVASTGLPAEVVQAVMRWIAGGSGGGRGAGGREMGPGGQTATRVEDGSGGDGGVPAGGVVAGLEQAERVIMPREEIAGWEREVAEARPVARAAVPEPQAREGSRGGGVEGMGPVRVTIGTVEIRVEAPVAAPMAAAGAARGESAPRRDRDRDREAGARRAASASASASGRNGGAGTRLRRHYILPH